MARIEPSDAFAGIPTVDLGQGDRINLGVAGIMSRLPDVAAAVGGVTAAVHETGGLPPRLMELVRLRIAFHNQCRSCMSVRYQSAIDDAVYGELRDYFSEDQLVALGLHCALCVGLGRLAATWHVVDDLPDEFRGDTDTPLAPWSASSVVASG
jgi:alkylhydroperoxidase/carboxymuconolactone decarboxylase family protein YurZ